MDRVISTLYLGMTSSNSPWKYNVGEREGGREGGRGTATLCFLIILKVDGSILLWYSHAGRLLFNSLTSFFPARIQELRNAPTGNNVIQNHQPSK